MAVFCRLGAAITIFSKEGKMRGKRLVIVAGSICLILALTCLPFAATSAKAQTQKTLRIGLLVCLSGWFSTFDALEWEEAQLARDILNERGGVTVKGQKYLIELVPEDCKSTADGVTAAANKLVFDQKVKFIAGPAAFFAAASKPICEPNKVIRAISFATNTPGEFGADTPYTFLCHNASVEHGLVAIGAMKKAFPSAKSVDLTIPDDGAIPYLDPIMRNVLKEHDLAVVGTTLGYANETVDFSPIAAKLASSKSDAVFMENGLPEHASGILKGIRELGSQKPVIAGLSGNADDIRRIVGQEAATNFVLIGLMPDMPNTPALMTEVQKSLMQKYGGQRAIHLQIFNSIWALTRVIQAAQSFDTTAVKEKWEKLDTVETVYGTGHMGGLKTYGIRHALSHPEPTSILDKGQVKFGGWEDPRTP
jgi:branched-chain amino acid transport system substrate-binding protein